MARVRDAWWDWRGGVNTTYSPDALDKSEVREAINARLTTFGALTKRTGSQRMHGTVLNASTKVLGVCQWDNPSQSGELIAICNADLFHKALGDANYTKVDGTLSTSNRVIFQPYKQGGTNRLYFADGGLLNKWTATSLTENISGSPSAKFIRVYKERMFASDGTPTIYWSKVNDAETWSSPDGGSAQVETYDSEGIVGMEVVGSSLLIFKEDSIARFTGVSTEDIEIDKDTEGVSPNIGCIAPGTICVADDFVFFLSAEGPCIANEAGVRRIGKKIRAELQEWDKSNWQHSWAVLNKERGEILLIVPDGAVNDVVWAWNIEIGMAGEGEEVGGWMGPWDFNYNIISAGQFERADGTHGILFGGDDGWVRDGDNSDNGAKDDVLSDDTGGTAVSMSIEFPPFLFGDPSSVKIMQGTQWVQADLGASGSLSCAATGDERPSSTSTKTVATTGAGLKSYKFSAAWRGHRPILTLTEATSNAITISGLTLEANLGRRVA